MVCHLHQLSSSLPWSPDVAEVMIVVVVVILEDVDPLAGDMAYMVVDRVALIKDHVNANTVRGIITSLRSAWRSMDTLNGHRWLILTLLPLAMLLMLLQPLLVLLVFPLW